MKSALFDKTGASHKLMFPWMRGLCMAAALLGAATMHGQTPKPEGPPPEPPTFANVLYGQLPEQNLDFWQAKSEGPTPLIINIHGGGWRHGEKAPLGRDKRYLDKGISIAQITYRFTPNNPLPAPVMDAARAVQFLRSKAKEWNIDPDKIILAGHSAGGCSALWLATHDDLAKPESADPVERYSTRVAGAVVAGAQTTIEPDNVRDWVGARALDHPMICNASGFRSNKDLLLALPSNPELAKLYREFSPINHLSPDDPPLLLEYAKLEPDGDIHGGGFGVKFKEKADALGMKNCYLRVDKHPVYTGYPGNGRKFIEDLLLAPKP